MLLPVEMPHHAKLMLKKSAFSKTFIAIPPDVRIKY